MTTVTMTEALRDAALPVGTMIPVAAASVPQSIRTAAKCGAGRFWSEAYAPLSSQGGCRFGCKVYVRRQGAVIRFAVLHSLAYGHSHSPLAR